MDFSEDLGFWIIVSCSFGSETLFAFPLDVFSGLAFLLACSFWILTSVFLLSYEFATGFDFPL